MNINDVEDIIHWHSTVIIFYIGYFLHSLYSTLHSTVIIIIIHLYIGDFLHSLYSTLLNSTIITVNMLTC